MADIVTMLEPNHIKPSVGEPLHYITQYNPHNADHHAAFIDLLIEQGAEHKRVITRERADAVSTMIGREFEVTLLCSRDGLNPVKGMTITKEADCENGRQLVLEDIIVKEGQRGQRFALHLINRNLIDAWEGGMQGWKDGLKGYTYETGRYNYSAIKSYKRIDPLFDPTMLPDVWRYSARQISALARELDPSAHPLATTADYNLVGETLRVSEERDSARLFQILERQSHNGIHEDSFIVAAKDGGLAFVSEAYSTFEVGVRADVRANLHPRFTEKGLRDLMSGVGAEIARRRRWHGFTSVHVEFANDSDFIDSTSLVSNYGKGRIERAVECFKAMGAELLEHDNMPMIAHSIHGKRYVAAVIAAANDPMTGRELSQAARHRLAERADTYGLEYRPAA